MIEDFEVYARVHYLPAVERPENDPLSLLAGLRFVQTRKVPGHVGQLREVFTTRRSRKLGREIDGACLDALLATTEDPVANARFLSQVATMTRALPTSSLAERSLRTLGPVACEALLIELTRTRETRHLRRLARYLGRISKIPPPKPQSFWNQADEAQRKEVVDRWREAIREAGGLDGLPPPKNGPNAAGAPDPQ